MTPDFPPYPGATCIRCRRAVERGVDARSARGARRVADRSGALAAKTTRTYAPPIPRPKRAPTARPSTRRASASAVRRTTWAEPVVVTTSRSRPRSRPNDRGIPNPYDCWVAGPDDAAHPARFEDYDEKKAYDYRFIGDECLLVLEVNSCDRDAGQPCEKLATCAITSCRTCSTAPYRSQALHNRCRIPRSGCGVERHRRRREPGSRRYAGF